MLVVAVTQVGYYHRHGLGSYSQPGEQHFEMTREFNERHCHLSSDRVSYEVLPVMTDPREGGIQL